MKSKRLSWFIVIFAVAFGAVTYLTVRHADHSPTFYLLEGALAMIVALSLGLEVGYLFGFFATLAGIGAMFAANQQTTIWWLGAETILIWTLMIGFALFNRRANRERQNYAASIEKAERTLAELRREISSYKSRIETVKVQTELRAKLARGVTLIGRSLDPVEIQEALKEALRINFPDLNIEVSWVDLADENALDPFERWVRAHRRFLLVSDAAKDERFRSCFEEGPAYPYRSLAIAPFHEVSPDARLGLLKVLSREAGRLSSDDIRILDLYALLGNLGFENAYLHQKVEELAIHDSLTGVFARKMFDEKLLAECSHASRFHLALSLAVIDVDHFKSFNDRFGHQTGDHLLVWLARNLRNGLRDVDFLARYGGEEFVILFPETPKEEASRVMEEMRRHIEAHGFVPSESIKLTVTVSVGVASFPNETATPQQLLRAADERLYMAKGMGRNRVISC